MIDKKTLQEFITGKLEGTDLYLVNLEISPKNEIRVEIDSDNSVDIDKCVELTREIENEFDRDDEDYELEVGSAGITSPLRLPRQYRKNIGMEVEVLSKTGEKLKGLLKEADDNGFVIAVTKKVKKEGSKRPVEETSDLSYRYEDIKYTKPLLKF